MRAVSQYLTESLVLLRPGAADMSQAAATSTITDERAKCAGMNRAVMLLLLKYLF